jgi:hypothetical protein
MGIQQIPLASSGLAVSDLITQPTWTQLASNTTTTGTATLSATSIPTTYKTLKIFFVGLKTALNQEILFRLNSDSGGRYASLTLKEFGTSSAYQSGSDATSIRLMGNSGFDTSTQPMNGIITIEDYTNTSDRGKFITTEIVSYNSGNDPFYIYGRHFYRPASAAAITSVSLSGANGGNINFVNDQTGGMFVMGAK